MRAATPAGTTTNPRGTSVNDRDIAGGQAPAGTYKRITHTD
jgi:hypothetical protein